MAGMSSISVNADMPAQEGVDYTSELLYDDALYLIFEKLSLQDLVSCSSVCSRWNRLTSHNYLWRPFLNRDFGPAPCIDSVCRGVYERCMSSDLWEKKQVIASSVQKVKAFVRRGFSIIYQTDSELVKMRDLYSENEVVCIPHKQSVAQMTVFNERLYIGGGSNVLTASPLCKLDEKQVLAQHKAWIDGFDITNKWMIIPIRENKIIN